MNERRLRRFGVVILASLMLAQIGLLIHKADHNAVGQDSPCVLCVSADHLASQAVTDSFTVAYLGPDRIAVLPRQDFLPAAFASSYRSRAPPQHS